MKRWLFGLVALIVLIPCWSHAQSNGAIKIRAEVVAYDKFGPLSQLTAAPGRQLLVVKVQKMIRGREEQPYLIIQERGFNRNSKVLEKVLQGRLVFEFGIDRNQDCDSSLSELIISIEGDASNPSQKETRLQWLTSTVPVPDDRRLKCYTLDSRRFRD